MIFYFSPIVFFKSRESSQGINNGYNEKSSLLVKSLGSVVELVDAPHSKCGTFGYVGSSPTAPTLMDTYSRCLLYTSPSPRDLSTSRMPSSA